MKASEVPLLVRREIEAAVLGQVYQTLKEQLGPDRALSLLTQAVESAARQAGAAFAAEAPGGRPNLKHFATIWQRLTAAPGSLEIKDSQVQGGQMTLTVTHCGYLELYRNMGLPAELGPVLSCARDFAFAQGYSPHLSLERPISIGQGQDSCSFRYTWRD
ncbi:MAG: hypothetical protein C4525_03795 [Desulfarculus sp.]|jgi:hypothetical protein|nr:MAG: hypothetical protein C4525_03795 [Desulfarculus sp.]